MTGYAYDHAGQRISFTAASGPTTYLLNDGNNPTGYPQIIEERQGTSPESATLSRSYIAGLRMEGQFDSQGATFFLRDGHGSNRALLDDGGNVIAAFDYQAFGDAIGFNPATAGTTQLFGGDAEFDAGSGNYYHDKRWRRDFAFLSFDDYESSDPTGLHKYLYCHGNPINGIDPTGMFEFSLTGMLVSTGISSILGAILSPIIKPAATYVADIFGGTLIGGFVDQWLNAMAGAPPALMLGADFMGGLGYSTLSVTTGISLEVLLSPSFSAGYLAWNRYSVSVGGSGSYLRGAAGVKAGVVFGSENAADYEGEFRSITLPLKSFPGKLRNKFVEWSGNFVGLAASGLTGLSSLGPAAQRWAPAYREGLAEITRLSQDLSWLNQKISNLAGESYVNIFWDPADGDPFGFAFEYGVGNAGSFSYTNSVYYQL